MIVPAKPDYIVSIHGLEIELTTNRGKLTNQCSYPLHRHPQITAQLYFWRLLYSMSNGFNILLPWRVWTNFDNFALIFEMRYYQYIALIRNIVLFLNCSSCYYRKNGRLQVTIIFCYGIHYVLIIAFLVPVEAVCLC